MLKTINCLQASDIIEQKQCEIFDVRDEKSYQEDHIRNAHYVNCNALNTFLTTFDKKKPIIVYCYKGIRSQVISQLLIEQGFQEVYSLQGGYEAWKNYLLT